MAPRNWCEMEGKGGLVYRFLSFYPYHHILVYYHGYPYNTQLLIHIHIISTQYQQLRNTNYKFI
jgi:hypothetical protein